VWNRACSDQSATATEEVQRRLLGRGACAGTDGSRLSPAAVVAWRDCGCGGCRLVRLSLAAVVTWRDCGCGGCRLVRLSPAAVVAWRGCRLARLSPGAVVAWRGCHLARLSPSAAVAAALLSRRAGHDRYPRGMNVHTLLLAAPRGFCAGVDRAVLIVEKALEAYGAPVYVRHEIVHNTHVVEALRRKGAVFVEDETEVPEGAVVVFSAHGSPPEAFSNSRRLGHELIDATCPLVTKVHHEARRFARDGLEIVLIGHEGHQEVVGTMGQAPSSINLVETPDDVDALPLAEDANIAYITQTTLSMDETAAVVDRLRQRFPMLHQPKKDDICYATQNRQDAVKELAQRCDVILVVGSQTSSNSKRLVEVSRDRSVPAYLIDQADEIDPTWVADAGVVGLTSGASAPEVLVEEVIDWFRARGTPTIDTVMVIDEDVEFAMPSNLARKLTASTPTG